MLRDPSLIPLSHQHHNGLALCVLTDRSLEADPSPENLQRLAQRAIDRYEIELANHFEIEEKILFPAILAAMGEAPIVAELIADHRTIEGIIAGLRKDPSEERLRTLTALLRGHIRREENELFQDAQKHLPREVLDDLGRRIDAEAVRVCL